MIKQVVLFVRLKVSCRLRPSVRDVKEDLNLGGSDTESDLGAI